MLTRVTAERETAVERRQPGRSPSKIHERLVALVCATLALSLGQVTLASGRRAWFLEVAREEEERAARCMQTVAPITYGRDGEAAAASPDGSSFAVAVFGPNRERMEVRIFGRSGRMVKRFFVADTSDCQPQRTKDLGRRVPRRVFQRVAQVNAFLRRGKYEAMERIEKDPGQTTEDRPVLRQGELAIVLDPKAHRLTASLRGKPVLDTTIAPLRVKGPRYPGLDCSGTRHAVDIAGWRARDWLLIEVKHFVSDECNVNGLTSWIGPVRLPRSQPQ